MEQEASALSSYSVVPLCCKCCTLISVCYTVKILYFKDVIYYILFRCDVRFCVVSSFLLLPLSSKKKMFRIFVIFGLDV